jgi:hypothetical protein
MLSSIAFADEYAFAKNGYHNHITWDGTFHYTLEACTPNSAGWKLKSAATCTSAAVYESVCQYCSGKSTKTVGRAKGHDYQLVFNPEFEADKCRREECSRCSSKKSWQNHTFDEGTLISTPTCTTAGQTKFTCTVENAPDTHFYNTEAPALGHDLGGWVTNTTQHWKECSRCDATDSRGNHEDRNIDGYCDICGYVMIIYVNKPQIVTNQFTYNGQTQAAQFSGLDTSVMAVTNGSKKDVGSYTATISLINTAKYRWMDGTTTPLNFTWRIREKNVYVTWEPETTFECNGSPQICDGICPSGVNGETIVLKIVTPQTACGRYTATASIESVTNGNKNNYILNNTTQNFEIVDTTRPAVTVSQNIDTWTNQNVVFTVSATDSGSGIKQIEYSMDQATWKSNFDSGTITSSGTKTFSDEQNSTIYFRAIDNKNNLSQVAGPYPIKIDKTRPTFTYVKSPDRDWTNDKVIVNISATDNIGVDQVKVNGTALTNLVGHGTSNGLSINKEGSFNVTENGTTTVIVTDVAGNSNTGTIEVSNIDKIAPTITFPATIDTSLQTIVAKDNVAPNSKMKYIAVSRSQNEPQVFGAGTSTTGNEYDYYYQVANNAEVSFNFTFNGEGTFYIFARDLAGNYTRTSTALTHKDINSPDVEITLDFGAGNPTNYVYDGLAHEPRSIVKDTTKNNTLVEGTDYTKVVTNNINVGTATITYTGIGNYNGTRTKTFEITPRDLNVVPKSGQNKFLGVDDPVFEYTYNNEVFGEVPGFSGALSRNPLSEEAGQYEITVGTLALVDNSDGHFLENNYTLRFQSGVMFEISPYDCLETTWTIPAGGTIKLPIPGYATNKYMVSWGDGTMDRYTMESFPSHTYNNTSTKDYIIRIAGSVYQFGYVEDTKPTSTNIYKDYLTFTDYLKQINKFGHNNLKRIGFSYCENLIGPIPARIGFDDLLSAENFFNECKNLDGTIPSEFFKNLDIVSAKNTFKNCEKTTGNLDASIFEGCTKINSFASTYEGCIGMTGTIPDGMFKSGTPATSFAKVFKGMHITGEIPENLFKYNTKANTFSEAFCGITGITKIPENLFATNIVATNYYRTFYGCTGISEVPTNLFINNVVGKITNLSSSYKDYRETFMNCTGITEDLDLDVLFIGKDMFRNCTGIKKIVLPNVVEIGDGGFYDCNSLINIKIVRDNLSTIGVNAFYYGGPNPPLTTYINTDSLVLYTYNWEGDNRAIDTKAPRGTVKIVAENYPFTKTEAIQLKITVEDDKTPARDCFYAVLNDSEVRGFKQEEIDSYRDFDRQQIIDAIEAGEELPESVFKLFDWKKFNQETELTTDWTLSNGEGVKTVYVYFMDQAGNISQVTQDLELIH